MPQSPPKRPYVVCHMIATIDGKILTRRWKDHASFKEPKSPVPAGDFIANAKAETFAISTDARGSVQFDDNEVGGDHIIVDGGGGEISGLYDLRDKAPDKAAYALRLLEQRTLKHGTQWLRYKVKMSN